MRNEEFEREWEKIDLRIDVEDAMSDLPERYKSVIIKRFYESKTLKAIGVDLGVTQERIRQMQAKALRMLRHPKRANLIKEYYI